MLEFFVPTATMIAYRLDNPLYVCVIRHAKKHDGKLTLPGGRKEPGEDPRVRAEIEFDEEAGGTNEDRVVLGTPKLVFAACCPNRDIREAKFGKLTFNRCPEEMRELTVKGIYGAPDFVFAARILSGTPAPRDGEAKECLFVDAQEVTVPEHAEESEFGAGHDLILALWRYLCTGGIIRPEWLADFALMRQFFAKGSHD